MFANVGIGGVGRVTRGGYPYLRGTLARADETKPSYLSDSSLLRTYDPTTGELRVGVRGMLRRVPTPDPERLGSRLGCLGRARHPASEKCEGAHSSPAQGVTLGSREQSLIMTSRRQWVKPVWEVVRGERRAV